MSVLSLANGGQGGRDYVLVLPRWLDAPGGNTSHLGSTLLLLSTSDVDQTRTNVTITLPLQPNTHRSDLRMHTGNWTEVEVSRAWLTSSEEGARRGGISMFRVRFCVGRGLEALSGCACDNQ